MSDGAEERVRVGHVSTADGDGPAVEMPVVQLLTGRGFVTGKSGSGKSNTASVVIEELLDSGYPVLIVDTDGEYYGLKEEYELLHAGADEECDIQVSPEHAEKLAALALEENVPIILDVSGYLDEDVADELLRETARNLFTKEKKLKKPFLLVVEEVHEYIPEGGGTGETGKMLIKIGKRGRKHGLGILGISQRPADVKKDFITQANWLVWHRLTWDNDTKVVGRVVDSEYAELVSDLGDGEAFVQTDWTDEDVRRVQFRRKRTFDAGATPGLDDFERPELKSVSESLVGDLADITDEQERRESRLADLQQEIDKKRAKIDQLQQELEQARDVSNAARQLANAFSRGDAVGTPDEVTERIETQAARIEQKTERIEELETELDERTTRIEELEATVEELREERDDAYERLDSLEAENDRLRRELIEARQSTLADVERAVGEQLRESDTNEGPKAGSEAGDPVDSTAAESDREEAAGALGTTKADPGAERESESKNGAPDPADDDPESGSDATTASDAEILENDESSEEPEIDFEDATTMDLLRTRPIRTHLEAAIRASQCNAEQSWTVIERIAQDSDTRPDKLETAVDTRIQHVWTLLAELRGYEFVDRDPQGHYSFDRATMIELIVDADRVNEQFQEFKRHATQVE